MIARLAATCSDVSTSLCRAPMEASISLRSAGISAAVARRWVKRIIAADIALSLGHCALTTYGNPVLLGRKMRSSSGR